MNHKRRLKATNTALSRNFFYKLFLSYTDHNLNKDHLKNKI